SLRAHPTDEYLRINTNKMGSSYYIIVENSATYNEITELSKVMGSYSSSTKVADYSLSLRTPKLTISEKFIK
ncbi:MAG: hypothetical protein PHW96_03445, partial [Candidatus Nanoarchaeia archaeon]|nr:hypothetical protein [Candidatus Nanoarchaeia archaeon]